MPCNCKVFAESNASVFFLGACMHECGSREAVDGVCGRGFQMPFDWKASAELNAFVYF